jgi:hypothetical protein
VCQEFPIASAEVLTVSPSEAQALIRSTLVPGVRGLSVATARYVIIAVSGDAFRLRSSAGHLTRAPIADVAQALNRGWLRVETD